VHTVWRRIGTSVPLLTTKRPLYILRLYLVTEVVPVVTRIQRWGNSQGLRFSKDILEQACLAVGEEVDVRVRSGTIVVKPAMRTRGKHRLKDLLARMPARSEPGEEDWGKPVGREAW
jgi:antitoxin MazE